ncbi:MAG: glycosyl hydrolase family 18 protein [Polyangiaceae bacterium]
MRKRLLLSIACLLAPPSVSACTESDSSIRPGGPWTSGGAGIGNGGNTQGGSGASGGAGTVGEGIGGSGGAAGAAGETSGGAGVSDAGGAAGDAVRILGGYWPYWPDAPVRVSEVHPSYNLIYLFHALPVGGAPGTTGAVYWSAPGDGRGAATHLVEDIGHARKVQGRKIILTVGGAGAGMSFPNRAKSQAFVDSVVSIYAELGGFDGLDWNTFEADQEPDTDEMIWISRTLKERFPGFLITSPPAPWRERDKSFCAAMVQNDALDYCAPQYYDGPGLDDPDYVVGSVDEWVSLLGPTHVAVGFGVSDATNYMTIDEVVETWKRIRANHPTIRGAFDWQVHSDEADGWRFGSTLGPLVAESSD